MSTVKLFISILPMTLFSASIFLMIAIPKFNEYRINKKIYQEALKGNPIAIKIAKNISWYRYEYKKIIHEALKGNENAIKILKLDCLDKYEYKKGE